MYLNSAGAARTVTGSCHQLDFGSDRLLIDCGLFQGPRELERLNSEPFPFAPGELEAVLLTHGHLDHVGRLPKLVRDGFSGPIHATRATREIAEIILRDSARLQQEDYHRTLRRARRAGRESEVPPPPYDESDVDRTLELFAAPVEFDRALTVAPGIKVTFRPAGHILGSAWIQLDGPDGRVIASGDLGNRESALQAPAVAPPECDAVLIETTYANRLHRGRAETRSEFREVIRNAIDKGGMVMIPSFALERTQGVLFQLNELTAAGELPDIDIYLDSPMATRMTRLYQTCANEFRPEIAARLERGEDPFEPATLNYTVSTEASKALNGLEGPAIVVAGSGMMTGGRILHHLKHNLWKREASLVVVGYQAHGSLGRRLVDGADRVRIYGEEIAVRAGIHTIGGFSAHADRDDLLHWLAGTGSAQVFLVHGENGIMADFADDLEAQGRRVTMPEHGRSYPLLR